MQRNDIGEKSTTLVELIDELESLSQDERSFLLYWLRSKKNAPLALEVNLTIKPNQLTLEDIYKERDAVRQNKV